MCIVRGIYGIARDASDYLMYQKYTTSPLLTKNAESIYKGYTLNKILSVLFNPIPYIITKDTTAKAIH